MLPSALLLTAAALARPEAPEGFCAVYEDAPACVAGAVSCTQCHDTSGPPNFNAYGADLSGALDRSLSFEEALPGALETIEDLDSDGDGLSNLEEIQAGSWPGWSEEIEPECSTQTNPENPRYELGGYDAAFAWKRVMLDFCGRSPRYEEVQAFAAAADPEAEIAGLLDACLGSPYWAEVLEEIGVSVIEPVGQASDVNILGNYLWDLRLFAYATSDGRDAGDLLQADYYVVEEPAYSGIYVAIDEPRTDTEAYAQPLPREHRYGLITTRYSLAMRIMFSPVPRNLTSHWYRELLGLDISRSEGLYPIDEAGGAYGWDAPLDVDGSGVWQEGCASCHATLDPLSYPWSRYNGIDLESGTTGTWLEDRYADLMPTTEGHLFGEPVDGPAEWVELAVQSDEFARTVTGVFWRYLLRRDPYTCEADAFDDLWRGFRDGGRDVEAMLHALVLTEAYGQP
jgi:hypothetical protein